MSSISPRQELRSNTQALDVVPNVQLFDPPVLGEIKEKTTTIWIYDWYVGLPPGKPPGGGPMPLGGKGGPPGPGGNGGRAFTQIQKSAH